MTTVSPAGSPVAVSSNLTVTVITGCPGDNRRLRAIGRLRRGHLHAHRGGGHGVQHRAERGELLLCLLPWLGVLVGQRLAQVGRGHGGRVPLGHPDAPDHADRRAARQVQGPGHVLGRLTRRDVPGLAGDRAAHRIQPGAEADRALDGDPVVGRAGPVQLPVGQPPDQGPPGEIAERGVDLGQADVVSPGQRGATRQSPARLPVHERRRHPVGEHRAGPGRARPSARSPTVTPRGRRGRLRGDRVVTSGGAGRHRGTASAAWARSGARGTRACPPERRSRLSCINDNVALTRLRPTRGRQDPGGPRPLICSAGKQKLNKRGTNRRPLDVI